MEGNNGGSGGSAGGTTGGPLNVGTMPQFTQIQHEITPPSQIRVENLTPVASIVQPVETPTPPLSPVAQTTVEQANSIPTTATSGEVKNAMEQIASLPDQSPTTPTPNEGSPITNPAPAPEQSPAQTPETTSPASPTPIAEANNGASNNTRTQEPSDSDVQNELLENMRADGWSDNQIKDYQGKGGTSAELNRFQELKARDPETLNEGEKTELSTFENKYGTMSPEGNGENNDTLPDLTIDNTIQNLTTQKDVLQARVQKGDRLSAAETVQLNDLKVEINERKEMAAFSATESSDTPLTPQQVARYNELKEKYGESAQPKSERAPSSEKKETTEELKIQLDQELRVTTERMAKGEISAEEAHFIFIQNIEKRKGLLRNLVERRENNDQTLTDFEKEMAEKGMRMEELMAQVIAAPGQLQALENILKETKQKYKEASSVQLSAEELKTESGQKKAHENARLRNWLVQIMASQAANIGRYANIAQANLNEFIDVNNTVEEKFGLRHPLYALVVSVGMSIRGVGTKMKIEIETQKAARR